MSPQRNQIQKVTIVGGGSAGWMTAAALANAIQSNCEIVLIESAEIGTIGVGEATIPPIKLFNQALGIDEAEFIRRTRGSFKLGIQFIDWAEKGHAYFHPFGSYGRNFDLVSLHHHWLREWRAGNGKPLDEYCMAWAMASRSRFSRPVADTRNVMSTFDYAYHFDAGLYAQFLREYAEERGVRRIEGRIVDVVTCSDDGFVESVVVDGGERITADLFVDCSGFRSLLLGEALGVGFEDWSHWLPCNRAAAIQCESNDDFTPYTRSTAREAGWQWRIPLQHRIGNGYVYCNEFVSDDEATENLLSNLDGAALGDPKTLKFKTGRREKFWEKNVIAVGLASGFMEPLESTSIHLVQSAISRLLGLFPDKNFDPIVIDEYNRITINEFERIRDFLILHYRLTHRAEDPLWRQCASMSVPDTLQYKIDHFRSHGRLIQRSADLFGPASWLAVHIGQYNWPQNTDPMLEFRTERGAENLSNLRQALAATSERQPMHAEFICQNKMEAQSFAPGLDGRVSSGG